jgi:hypothetical protein
VVPLDVGPKPPQIRAEALLDRGEPRLASSPHVDAAELEQVVLDLLEDERVDVTLRLLPIRDFPGLESGELQRKPCSKRTLECRLRALREALLRPGERVLELVVGKRLDLGEVALGEQLEIRLAILV